MVEELLILYAFVCKCSEKILAVETKAVSWKETDVVPKYEGTCELKKN